MIEEFLTTESENSPFDSDFEDQPAIFNPSTSAPTIPYPTPATFIYPTIPSQTHTMAAALTHTVLNMPVPKSKLAPETFRGDYAKVKDFIDHYDRLLLQHNVITHKDRCETIIRYCGRRERETIKNIDSYSTPDWTRLREDILKVYDADRDTKRYTVKDVMGFARRRQRRRISDLAAWKKYVRSFLRIAGSLLKNRKLTTDEHATYFWKGIPRITRIRLENRLLAANPGRNLSTPFTVTEIDQAAEALLQRDRFDNALDSDSDDESFREEWSSDSETSDSESEDEVTDKKKNARRKNKSAKKHKLDSTDEEEDKKKKKSDLPRRKVASGRQEVEGLIRQLNSMSNEDPGYGLTYYKAVKLDRDVDKVVRAPRFKTNTLQHYTRSPYPAPAYAAPVRIPATTYQTQSPPNPAPPHLSAANSYPVRPPGTSAPRREDIRCYGCGETGHGMSNCQKLADLINQGVLTRDNAGRVVKIDGSGIRRIGNENFVEAIAREGRPQSHLVTINNEYDIDSGTESDTDSDDEPYEAFEIRYDDVYAVQGGRYDAYAADKTEKRISAKRKEVLDGVYPPPLKRQSGRVNKEKENKDIPASIIKTIKPLTRLAKRVVSETPVVPTDQRRPLEEKGTGIPTAGQVPRFDPANDADMLEDDEKDRETREVNQQKPLGGVKTMPGERKIVPRQSAVSAHVDPMNVMNQLLNTRISLAVGEVLGISRELSAMVSDSIKVKSVKTPPVPVALATSFQPKTRGLLIKITLECDGAPIEAIIDTGSQLNIVSDAICKSKLRRPVDKSKSVNMNDANGGERALQGLVSNVPLVCGGVHTEANLYVGSHVPFQMLLGRPWQRGNFVSIDERPEGTYLIFKDPKSSDTRYEMLVTPDKLSTVDWDFEPSAWHITEPSSYLIEVPEDRSYPTQSEMADRVSDSQITRPYSDHINFTKYGTTDIERSAINYLDEVSTWTTPNGNLENLSETIRTQEICRSAPSHFPDILPPQAEMALNVSPIPISSHVEDLPIIYSIAAPARSEADDLRDALHHEEFLNEHGHFSNIAINSTQAFVTGYHTDGQGNKFTAITGLRSGCTTVTSNGPQTVYGHYAARFYTDLDPIPSVIIPSCIQPTQTEGQADNCVSRNTDPPDWTDLIMCLNRQQPPNRENVQAPGEASGAIQVRDQIDQGDQKLPLPYTPTTYSPSFSTVSRPDSDSSDDENWLPCGRCHKTHGERTCIYRPECSLVRISSNGSISSSVHIPDNPISDYDFGRPNSSISWSSSDIGESDRSSEVLVYPSDTTDTTASSLAHPTLLSPIDISHDPYFPPFKCSSDTRKTSAVSPSGAYIPYLPSESDVSSSDEEDMGNGILSLWNEYRKELREDQIDGLWGMSPYQIIMELSEEKVEELANTIVAREMQTAKSGKHITTRRGSLQRLTSGNIPVKQHLASTPSSGNPARPQEIPQCSDPISVDSPIKEDSQECQGLAPDGQHLKSVAGSDYKPSIIHDTSSGQYSVLPIPETFPFTYTSDYPQPAPSSPGTRLRQHPSRNKHRKFQDKMTAQPIIPPVTVYSTTTPHTHVFATGAEPMTPESEHEETGDEYVLVRPTLTYPPAAAQMGILEHQEMEPVLTESRDSPPPMCDSPLPMNGATTDVRESPPGQTNGRDGHTPLPPTRPNTPHPAVTAHLFGEDLDRALANITADAQHFSRQVNEIPYKDIEIIDTHVQIMHGIDSRTAHAGLKQEIPGHALLPKGCEGPADVPGLTFTKQEAQEYAIGKVTRTLPTPPDSVIPPLRITIKPLRAPTPPQKSIRVVKKARTREQIDGDEEMSIAQRPTRLQDVPMGERPYRPESDYTEGATQPRIGQIIALDMRTRHPISGYENPPIADAYIRFATVMTGVFEPYIFPDVVHNTPSGPYALPIINATHWGARVDNMFECRTAALGIIRRIEQTMTPAQMAELKRPLITMFITSENGALVEACLDRSYFFRTLHPFHNPFLSLSEATFLRGACYHFRRIQQTVLADAIDVLLRSPQYDDFYCRRLLEIGCLEKFTPFQKQRGLDFIRLYEDELLDDVDSYSRDAEGDDEKDMEVESYYEPEQID